MRRRSAISAPGSAGGLSCRSISAMRVSSSSTLPPSASTSSARATPARRPNPHTRALNLIGLLLGLRRLRLLFLGRVLVLNDVLFVIDVEAVLHVGRDDVALFVTDDLQLHLLTLPGGEGPAGLDR